MTTVVLLRQVHRVQGRCKERWFRLHVILLFAPTYSQLTFTPVGVFPTAIAIGGQKFEPQPMDGLASYDVQTKMNCSNITHSLRRSGEGNPSREQYTLQVGRHGLREEYK